MRGGGDGEGRGREKERALLGIIRNRGSRAAPAHSASQHYVLQRGGEGGGGKGEGGRSFIRSKAMNEVDSSQDCLFPLYM